VQRENKRFQNVSLLLAALSNQIVITVVSRRDSLNARSLISSAFLSLQPEHNRNRPPAALCCITSVIIAETGASRVIWVNLVRNLLLTIPVCGQSDPRQHKVYSALPQSTTCCPAALNEDNQFIFSSNNIALFVAPLVFSACFWIYQSHTVIASAHLHSLPIISHSLTPSLAIV